MDHYRIFGGMGRARAERERLLRDGVRVASTSALRDNGEGDAIEGFYD